MDFDVRGRQGLISTQSVIIDCGLYSVLARSVGFLQTRSFSLHKMTGAMYVDSLLIIVRFVSVFGTLNGRWSIVIKHMLHNAILQICSKTPLA